jgi:hypothetical protein
MTAKLKTTWGAGLHQTFRLLPTPSSNLRLFLESNGLTPDHVLKALPYDAARSRTAGKSAPDPKRYRDGRQIYSAAGLLYEGDEGLIHVTSLGKATLRWLDLINEKNVFILGRHAAYCLAACQLRNPTGAGQFDATVTVFPYAFIWRVMLALDGWISSDELNRAVFKITNESDLLDAIEKIRDSRKAKDPSVMGDETVTGDKKEDRIIPWMSIASFGWTMIADKKAGGGVYQIKPQALAILREAARVRHKHREFHSERDYVEHISRAAALPEDLR